jgi:Pyridoxal-phosphate dependent enzyme
VSFAKQLGLREGLTYSSGNAGASLAAYAARAGMQALVLVEHVANPSKRAMVQLLGATVAVLEFDSMEEINAMLAAIEPAGDLYQFVNFINPTRHDHEDLRVRDCRSAGLRSSVRSSLQRRLAGDSTARRHGHPTISVSSRRAAPDRAPELESVHQPILRVTRRDLDSDRCVKANAVAPDGERFTTVASDEDARARRGEHEAAAPSIGCSRQRGTDGPGFIG